MFCQSIGLGRLDARSWIGDAVVLLSLKRGERLNFFELITSSIRHHRLPGLSTSSFSLTAINCSGRIEYQLGRLPAAVGHLQVQHPASNHSIIKKISHPPMTSVRWSFSQLPLNSRRVSPLPSSSAEVRMKLAFATDLVSLSGSLETFLVHASSWTRLPTSLNRFAGKLVAALRAGLASMTCRQLATRAFRESWSYLAGSTKHLWLLRGAEHVPGLTWCKSVRARGARGGEAGQGWRMLARGLWRRWKGLSPGRKRPSFTSAWQLGSFTPG